MTVFTAIEQGDAERVRELVRENPRVAKERNAEGVSALLVARYYGRDEIAQELAVPDEELDVFEAAALGRTERLRELLDEDAGRANAWASDGFHPLGLAVFFGHVDAARLLVERGADVNAAARHVAIKASPIHSATATSDAGARYELAKLLLEHGADPNARQEGGFTALHGAAQHGDDRVKELLLQHGADPDAKTDDGRTAADF